IAITPGSATNEVGNAHTFTVTVTAAPSGATPVTFNSITPTTSGSPTTFTSTCGSPTVSGNTATCLVTINNTPAGTYTPTATTSVTTGTVTISRSTASNSGPAGPGPAPTRRSYELIAITPGSATNEVGSAHTFTVTVTAAPSGATPVTFNSITP